MTPPVSRTRLQREWVLCAIAAAASRFVPIPLVDDLIKTRAERTAVTRTWTAHGRPRCPAAVGILADDTTGCLTELARSIVKLPLLVLLYPIRKIFRILTALHGVSADLIGVVLLARSVDRCLRAGWFTGTDVAVLEDQARRVRRAHDEVVHLADLHLLDQAVTTALRSVDDLRSPATAFARRVFARRAFDDEASLAAPSTPEGAAPGVEEARVEEARVEDGVRQIVAVLDRPEVSALLADLDKRFDAALAASARRSPGGPGAV
jgi:hypothetical protein